MTKTYRSKVGPELVVTFILTLGGPLLLMIYLKSWPGIAIVSFCLLLIIHLLTTTYYQILGKKLRIKSGLFFDKTIDITTIVRIEATRTLISAPATSLNRLELIYNRYDSVIISPEDREGFVNDLLTRKPDIEVIV